MAKLWGLFHTWTYKKKLILYSVILSIAPVFILGMISSYITSSNIRDEVSHNQRIILNQLELQVDSYMQSLDKISLQLANDEIIQQSLQSGLSQVPIQKNLLLIDTLQKWMNVSDIQFEVTLGFTRYSEMYSSRMGIVRELKYPYSDIFLASKKRYEGLMMIPPFTYTQMPELMMVRTVPLNSSNPYGYLIIHLDIIKLKRFIAQLDLGGNRKVLIVDEQGKVVTSKDVFDIGTNLNASSPLYPFWLNPVAEGEVTVDHQRYNVLSLKSKFNNWTYIALTSVEELNAKSDFIRKITWGTTFVLALVWALVALIGSRWFYSPIQRLLSRFSLENNAGQDEYQTINSFMNRMMVTNDSLKSSLNEHEPFRKDSIFLQMLRGEITDEIIQYMSDGSFPLQGNGFHVVAVDIDQFAAVQKTYQEKDRFLMMYGLRNVIEELSQPLSSYVTVIPKPGQIVLIIGLDDPNEDTYRTIAKISDQIRDNVRSYLKFTVTIAISNESKEIRSLYLLYQDTLRLLENRWLLGSDRSITLSDEASSMKKSSRELVKWKNAVVNSIKQGDFSKARIELKEVVETIPHSLNQSKTTLGLFAYLISEIDMYFKEMDCDLDHLFEYHLLDHLYQLSSLDEVIDWMANSVLETVENRLKIHNQSRQKILIPKVLLYMQENYDTDLSLQRLSDVYGASPSTLSRMFREETGINYQDYIIQFRMDKAKEWLMHTDYSIKDIANRLRYTSVQNFTRTFKQVVGAPPGNYRKVNRGE